MVIPSLVTGKTNHFSFALTVSCHCWEIGDFSPYPLFVVVVVLQLS